MTHPHDATEEGDVAATQPMKEEDDSGNDDASSDDEDDDGSDGGVTLGGAIDSPAFCLLAGMEDTQDPSTGKVSTKCQFPITRLPATLGRTHAGGGADFVPLGASKALSRNHCLITYRDVHGGELVGTCEATEGGDGDELVYRPKKRAKTNGEEEGSEAVQDADDPGSVANIIRPSGGGGEGEASSSLPEGGFFALQCLGKNKVVVGGRTVQKGQVALLRHGMTIHLASHWLYFLLPATSSTETMEVPNPAYAAYREAAARRAKLSASTSKDSAADVPRRVILSGAMTTKDLEKIPVETLLQTQTDAIEADQWDRKMQMIGTAISLRAVRDSARSRELRDIARKEGGVARADVMQWIAKKPLYAEWVKQMLSKMELKSYQSNIGKALSKTGFVRGGTTGRHVRWALPTDLDTDASDESDGDGASHDPKSGGNIQDDDSDDGGSSEDGDDDDDDDDGDTENVRTGGGNDDASSSVGVGVGGDQDDGSALDESIDGGGDETMSSSMALKDIENVPVETLLKTMTSAIRANQWDRKLQMIGTAISNHAVLASARSQEMIDIARKEGGVARAEVMKWIAESPVYSEWVKQMLSKMEVKSYQSNIGKALSKTGFVRTGTTGRHVRWALPTNLQAVENNVSDEEESSSLEQKSKASIDHNRNNVGSSDSNDDKDDDDDNDNGVGGDSDNLSSSDVEDEVDDGVNSMDVQDESEERPDASGADESLDEDDANEDEAEDAENSALASHSSQDA